MDHLACFVGGMLALGSAEVEGLVREPLLKLAGELTETCVKMYTRQKSGVSPEFVEFPAQQDFINGPGYYILRPETMESLFYMWRFTKDQKWRDYGWKIFRAIDRWCKVETGGYSGLKEVNVKTPLKDNLMQSFWMAETLKYAYLLFADDDAFDLSLWVFNTEAHPLRRRQRDPLDVWREFEKVHGDVPFYPPDIDGVIPTETDNMKQRRARRKGRIQSVHDNLGEDFADGPVDDDGQPYDPIKGARGLPKHPGSDVGGPYVVGEF
ncbi:mannosyl-oligosaccharide alpha-1,2-mannosidase, putative [Bodo saltans]|uniref:alpha-1,2-Mannosidase n=1 Tax=Bodo saltans TaxID=75058 RepID=A0A0S4J5H8_BODSA|nr:mannosyl-oligosaccharide alpha-1,2-mannosidase, putative [Bodo saltans]|eukprot:CUG31017.1 mannosyl-oligosaccharide alpha-1,2-mannosidase, putative [Bodo saltans]